MLIGRRIVTDSGSGVRRTAGRGLVTNRGVGRRITTGVGYITTTGGRGCQEISSTASEVGGGRRSSYSTSRLVMTFVGIRYRITSGIRIRGDIGMGIDDRRIPVVVMVDTLVIIRARVVAVVGTIIRRAAMAIRAIRVEEMGIVITRRGVV